MSSRRYGLERKVKHSEPPVPEDHEQRERNHLLAEEQKRKKDATKRKRNKNIHVRDALEKRHRQQARDRLPREESPSKLNSDDEDFNIFWMRRRRRASGARCPHKGLMSKGRGLRGARCYRKRGQGSSPLALVR
jgi:hypothetical protein